MLLFAASLAAAAFAWQQGAVRQFQQDGKTISTNLRVVDGTLMVSAKDVASYLGGDLTVENGTATIVAKKAGDQAGGAPVSPLGTQPAALGNLGAQPFVVPEAKRPDPKEITTKIGSDADNDGFVLRVTSVDEVKKPYRTTFDPRNRRIDPNLPDERLVVVRMRVENATDETRRPPVPSTSNVTLFGEDRVGVSPIAFDARPMGDSDLNLDLGPYGYGDLEAPVLAPKGAFEFAVVFSLPKDRTPTRLTVALPAAREDQGGANVTVALN